MFTPSDPRVADLLKVNQIPLNASIFNTKRDEYKTTTKYTETDDIGVIQQLNSKGWFVRSYNELKPHKSSRQGFQKYCAMYFNPELDQTTGSTGARLLQIGSHDGSTPLTFRAGLFEFACSNGLIVGESLFEPLKFKHLGSLEGLGDILNQFLGTVPNIFGKVNSMKRHELSDPQVVEFARLAIPLRYDTEKYTVDPQDVLNVRRTPDNGNKLWQVYNRVQENLTYPLHRVQASLVDSETQELVVKSRKPKALRNIDTNVRMNTQLWDLAESFLQQ